MSVASWSVEKVVLWLEKEGFRQHIPAFQSNGVDGKTLLDLTSQDLKSELEIASLQDRKDIFNAIQRLKEAPPAGVSPIVTEGVAKNPHSDLFDKKPGSSRTVPEAVVNSTQKQMEDLKIYSGGKVCARCAKPIGLKYLQAFGREYHEDCFLCGFCNLPIRETQYATSNNEPFHPDCLARHQGDICFKCLQVIAGVVVTARGHKYHPDCFVCGTCLQPIADTAFLVSGDQCYHSTCRVPPSPRKSPRAKASPFDEPRKGSLGAGGGGSGAPAGRESPANICAGCGTSLGVGTVLTALGKRWHKNCFKCCKCHQPIHEDKFLTETGGDPYHVNCRVAEPASPCHACNLPVTDEVIHAMNVVWHPECFKCSKCRLRIMGEKFAVLAGAPIHTYCQ